MRLVHQLRMGAAQISDLSPGHEANMGSIEASAYTRVVATDSVGFPCLFISCKRLATSPRQNASKYLGR